MRPKIVVVGSSNTDMGVRSEHLPVCGETVLGQKFIMTAGGKGANQAVAAARLGRDLLGDRALAGYQAEGINTACIVRDDDEASGVALIVVDSAAENIIAVAPGANGRLSPEDVRAAVSRARDFESHSRARAARRFASSDRRADAQRT